MALISKEKADDLKWRAELLYMIEEAFEHFRVSGNMAYYEFAIEMEQISRELKERIERGDYTERDRRRAIVDRLLTPKFSTASNSSSGATIGT